MARTSKAKSALNPESGTTKNAVTVPGWLQPYGLYAGLMFVLGVLLYVNTYSHGYTLDDAIVISENMFTEQGVEGIPGLLSHDTFYGFFKDPGKSSLVAGGRYRPVTPVMFAIETSLFGEQRVAAGHVINSLLYGLTAMMVFVLLVRLFNKTSEGMFIALGAALLFAVHPVHTEAVANIKGRDEIVALLGSIVALWLVVLAVTRDKPYLQIPAGLAFFVALLSKENAITFLAIIPLTLYFFTTTNLRKSFRHTLPVALVAIVFVLLRGYVVGWSVLEAPRELMNNPFLKLVGDRWVDFTLAEKSASIAAGLWEYFRLMVVPHPLTHDYYPRFFDVMNWTHWKALAGLLVSVGMVAVAVWGYRRKDPIAYGILFYLITLSIASNIVFPVGTHLSERFLFMPSVGLAVAAAALVYRGIANTTPRRLSMGMLLLVAFAVPLAAKTISRNSAWKDNFTLFATDVSVSANSAKLQNACGGEMIARATRSEDAAVRADLLRQAKNHLLEAIRIHPTYKGAFLLLGNCLSYGGEFDDAIAQYHRALELDPAWKDARSNLAITCRTAAKVLGERKGNIDTILAYLSEANRLVPNDFETLRLLGVANAIAGNVRGSQTFFREALRINERDANLWFDLALSYRSQGDMVSFTECVERAKRLDPSIEQRRRANRK